MENVSPGRMPALIRALIAIDVALVALYLLDYAAGHPSWKLSQMLDLELEGNLPTWYSTLQLFFAAATFALFAFRNRSPGQRRAWVLLVVPAVLLFFSLDEVAELHEWLGYKLDVFLPGGLRRNTPFWYTGIYMFVVGIPVTVAGLFWIVSLRRYFARVPRAFWLLLAGFGVMMGGAAGIETIANFVPVDSFAHVLEVVGEEFSEMLGVTLMLWSGVALLQAHRFSWHLEPWHPGGSGDATNA